MICGEELRTMSNNKEANIRYHTAMADTYDKDQPHFSRENTERVEVILEGYAQKHGNSTLLDVGCGTGYILRIARKVFTNVVGVDITPAMLEKARAIGGVTVHEACSDSIPFPSSSFGVITAYGFLHHLSNLLPTLREIYRCLRAGGVFYADQDPNYYCWQALKFLSSYDHSCRVSGVLQNEIESIRDVANTLNERYGLDEQTVRDAEYHKYHEASLREDNLRYLLDLAGFKNVKVHYHWYLGQGKQADKALTAKIHEELLALLPLSRPLFKYISLEAIK